MTASQKIQKYKLREMAHELNRNHAFEDGVIWAIQNLDKLKIKQ
jgi:hypothetical protein